MHPDMTPCGGSSPHPPVCQGLELRRRWASDQEVTGQGKEIGRQHRRLHVAFERHHASPGAAVETEGSFEEGDHAFDSCPEVTQPLVDPTTPGHVADLEAPLLLEADVLDPQG